MQIMTAVARITGGAQMPAIRGVVRFLQRDDGVLVTAEISGLPQRGFFGFHIHEGASCTGAGFSDTRSHYNPGTTEHPNHAGDLPPLLSAGGNAYLSVVSDRFRLAEVLGKTVVIHSKADDFTSQPAGNAGEKVACGVIRRG